jgi:hypothetical protein
LVGLGFLKLNRWIAWSISPQFLIPRIGFAINTIMMILIGSLGLNNSLYHKQIRSNWKGSIFKGCFKLLNLSQSMIVVFWFQFKASLLIHPHFPPISCLPESILNCAVQDRREMWAKNALMGCKQRMSSEAVRLLHECHYLVHTSLHCIFEH